ncbi:MAG: SDR family oxidoreductase [Planctomycetes bacterium]|nr:SDR family oxidoreductase [Planctomycetota bacterium]NUQ35961.1 SDR family oxidoreductase [Planctomycetaceae bacterium]
MAKVLRDLLTKEADLGTPHMKVPNLKGKNVLVIGADRPSGFGYNFAKVAALEGGATAYLTVQNDEVKKSIEETATFKPKVSTFEVTDPNSLKALGASMPELDAVVYAPAYLNRKYFGAGKNWDDIDEKDKQESLLVSAEGAAMVAHALEKQLSARKGVVYGVSFSLPDLPPYTIGRAKTALEDLVTKKMAPELKTKGIRANILLLTAFSSVSSLMISRDGGVDRLLDYVESQLKVARWPLGQMVREAVATITDPRTGHIFELDNGLRREAWKDRARLAKIYADGLAAMSQ